MDWLVSVISIIAIIDLGNKNPRGWLWKSAANAIWTYLAWTHGLYGVIPVCVISGVVMVRNYFKWTVEPHA